MAKKIEKLTAAQEKDLQVTYEKWLRIGRSTERVDPGRVSKAIQDMYARAGKDRPAVMHFSSPGMCILAHAALTAVTKRQGAKKLGDQLRSQLGDQLRSQLGGQLWGQLWGQLRDQLWGQLRSQLWGQLRSQLNGQLGDQLDDQLGDQLWDQLRSQLRSQLRDQLWGQIDGQLRSQLEGQLWGQLRSQLNGQLGGQLWGQLGGQLWGQIDGQIDGQLEGQLRDQLGNYFAGHQWCAWEVFYDFCNRIGVKYTDEQRSLLDLWLAQSEACHWWFPYEGIALASDRPNRLEVDSRGRMHSTSGPALRYTDGWAIYAINGVAVTPEVIEHPERITAKQISDERNAEVRRVLLGRFGESRYLQDIGAKRVHQDSCGELYRADLAGDEPLTMVKVLNSTPEPDGSIKPYWLRVPPNMKTAHEAVAWTFAIKPEDYKPAMET